MLRLLLLRHSKAERARSGERDHERQLAERGRDDAPKIGAYLSKHRYLPDRVVVSTSARTRETWSLAAAAIPSKPGKPQVDFDERIYESTPKALLAVIQETGPKVRTLMLVGHNPSMQELAVQLVATGDIETRERLQEALPTSGLAVFEFVLDGWDRVHPQSGRLKHFITPRSIAEPTA
jgi:phosphohistidine phosphatase